MCRVACERFKDINYYVSWSAISTSRMVANTILLMEIINEQSNTDAISYHLVQNWEGHNQNVKYLIFLLVRKLLAKG